MWLINQELYEVLHHSDSLAELCLGLARGTAIDYFRLTYHIVSQRGEHALHLRQHQP